MNKISEVPPTKPSVATQDGGDFVRRLRGAIAHPFRWGLILGGLIVVAVVVLVAQNGESARIDWLWLHFSTPLWLMLFLTLISGALVWETVKASIRHGRQVSDARRVALDRLEGESGRRSPATAAMPPSMKQPKP